MTSQTYNLDGPKEFPFPYPVRSADQLTVEIVPGAAVAPGDYEVVGVGPTSTQVTVRYPNAPTSGGLQLKITRYVAPERVTQIDSPSDINVTNLNAEFNNVYEAMTDLEATVLQQVQDELDAFQDDVLDPAVATTVQARDDALAARDAAQAAETGAGEKWDDFRDRYWGAYASDPSESPVGSPPDAGDLYFNTTASEWRVWNGEAWQQPDTKIPSVYDRRDYVATAGQDTFAVNYDAPFVQVWVNGALLPPSDYEASSGTDVVLNEGVPEDTEVTVVGIFGASATELDALAALVFETYEATLSGYTEDAEAAAARAETARDAAQLSAGIYDDTAAGLAATSDGEYFSVPSAESDEFLILYRNDSGSATETDTYPNSAAVESRVRFVPDIAALRALTGVQDGQRVSVTGYHPGSTVGGGGFVWKADEPKANHNGGTVIDPDKDFPTDWSVSADVEAWFEAPASGEGCWVLSTSSLVTPRSFGAVDGGLAQELMIERFFSWAGTNQDGAYQMAHDGDYYVSRGVRVEACSGVTFQDSRLIIRPPSGTYIDETGLRLYSVDDGTWGSLQVLGDSSGGGFRNGILATRIRRGKFRQMQGNYCRLWGVAVPSADQPDDIPSSANNSNGAIVDKIDAAYCGSNAGHDISFTEISRNYAPSNPGQTSTISVDLDDYYPTPARGTPFFYNGLGYVVLSYDSNAQEAVVTPCLAADPGGMVSGTLTLLPGGGLCLNGGDSGQLRTEQINVRFSSCGVCLQAAYGSDIKGLTSQFNGVDIVHGRPPTSFANAGEVITAIYSENKTFRNVLSLTQVNSYIDIWGSIESFDDNEILRPLPETREQRGDGPVRFLGSSGEAGTRLFHGVPRVTTWRRGTPGQAITPQGDIVNCMAWPGGIVILSPDNGSRDYPFNLGVKNANTQAFGDSGFALVGLGFGPGNEITLTAPAGETVEGVSSYTLPALPANFFAVAGRVTPVEWSVAVIELPSVTAPAKTINGSATYDPASLADGESATTTVTVTGAALGDFATASFAADLQGITLDAWVSAADTVSVRFTNNTGAAVDLASATLRARVEKA